MRIIKEGVIELRMKPDASVQIIVRDFEVSLSEGEDADALAHHVALTIERASSQTAQIRVERLIAERTARP